MAIIESHLDDPGFLAEDFQKEIGMSRMQLHRKLKALTDHAPGEFIRVQRLVRASEMLSKTDSNVTEVCYQTGFTSLSYFAKCFKNSLEPRQKFMRQNTPRYNNQAFCSGVPLFSSLVTPVLFFGTIVSILPLVTPYL